MTCRSSSGDFRSLVVYRFDSFLRPWGRSMAPGHSSKSKVNGAPGRKKGPREEWSSSIASNSSFVLSVLCVLFVPFSIRPIGPIPIHNQKNPGPI